MTRRPRPQPCAGILGKSGPGAIKGENTLAELAQLFYVHANQITQWRGQLHQGAARREIAISMYGRGSWRDNGFVERLWRSIKYEEVYLRAYETVSEARASIGRYLDFYNGRRPHSSLDRNTPDAAYFNALMPIPAAA